MIVLSLYSWIDQLLLLHKQDRLGSFSIYFTLINISANMLRLSYYPFNHYKVTLLVISLLLIVLHVRLSEQSFLLFIDVCNWKKWKNKGVSSRVKMAGVLLFGNFKNFLLTVILYIYSFMHSWRLRCFCCFDISSLTLRPTYIWNNRQLCLFYPSYRWLFSTNLQ